MSKTCGPKIAYFETFAYNGYLTFTFGKSLKLIIDAVFSSIKSIGHER